MLSEQLLSELLTLSRSEKLQVMQVLVNDLSAEEIACAPLARATELYENWLPYAAFEDAMVRSGQGGQDAN